MVCGRRIDGGSLVALGLPAEGHEILQEDSIEARHIMPNKVDLERSRCIGGSDPHLCSLPAAPWCAETSASWPFVAHLVGHKKRRRSREIQALAFTAGYLISHSTRKPDFKQPLSERGQRPSSEDQAAPRVRFPIFTHIFGI